MARGLSMFYSMKNCKPLALKMRARCRISIVILWTCLYCTFRDTIIHKSEEKLTYLRKSSVWWILLLYTERTSRCWGRFRPSPLRVTTPWCTGLNWNTCSVTRRGTHPGCKQFQILVKIGSEGVSLGDWPVNQNHHCGTPFLTLQKVMGLTTDLVKVKEHEIRTAKC